jgi:hypothetical protein
MALPLVAAAGCRGVGVLGAPPPPGPDVTTLRSAIAAEQLMIARYQAVLRTVASAGAGGAPALTAVLSPLLAEHRAHLAQLRSRLIVPPGGAAAAAASASAAAGRPASAAAGRPASPAAPSQPARVPTAPAAALAFLAAAERNAAAAVALRLRAAPGSLAQLYASIAASEATHVPVLQAAGRTA